MDSRLMVDAGVSIASSNQYIFHELLTLHGQLSRPLQVQPQRHKILVRCAIWVCDHLYYSLNLRFHRDSTSRAGIDGLRDTAAAMQVLIHILHERAYHLAIEDKQRVVANARKHESPTLLLPDRCSKSGIQTEISLWRPVENTGVAPTQARQLDLINACEEQLLELFEGYVDQMTSSGTSYVTLKDQHGNLSHAEIASDKLTNKGIGEQNRFECRIVSRNGDTTLAMSLLPRAHLSDEDYIRIQNGLNRLLPDSILRDDDVT